MIGVVAALVVAAACAEADTGRESATEQTTSATAATAADIEAHNNADVWFVRLMVPRYQQEIEMTDILLGKGDVDPRVTDLAGTIKTARSAAIQQMQDWLTQWGGPPMPGISSDGMHTAAEDSVPGQLTERELSALRDARGVDAGRMFLTQMIAHQEGAISLAQTEIEEGQYPPAVALARRIASTHQQEVDTMRGLLAAL